MPSRSEAISGIRLPLMCTTFSATRRTLLMSGQRWKASILLCALANLMQCQAEDLASAKTASNTPSSPANGASSSNQLVPTFVVTNYQIQGHTRLSSSVLDPILAKHTGSNVTVLHLVRAASDVLSENRARGYPPISIAIAEHQITHGIVTMNLFQGNSQILISGKPYSVPGPIVSKPPETNAVPHFEVSKYEIIGDTLLSDETLTKLLTNYIGTNITVSDIVKAASDLQLEYRARGFPTVNVTLPPQQITNAMVKIRVFVGRLSEITVTGNRYFSSNNVMRSIPSLRTNMILNGPIFQAELDRANANQDRQIYPQIEPGETVNTTALKLEVKDRLPLHTKLELNNQSSPDTPALRLNSSATYNNLWEHEHSLGVQYSFSPEAYKSGTQWNFYDLPLVANYSAFYRLPLGNPTSMTDGVAANPGSFGYDEATRKFRLPPPSGGGELNVYASRSSIDTGVETTGSRTIFSVPGVRQVTESDSQQDVTINETIGFRLSGPLPQTSDWRSTWSAGTDFKLYNLTSNKTNSFQFTEVHLLENGTPVKVVSEVHSAVPTTRKDIDYLPIGLRYDGSLRDALGSTSFGLGLSVNAWHSGSLQRLRSISGSSDSLGYWVTLNPSLSRDFTISTNWILSLRADGQWASEPLITNERFGVGGVNSVRGYHEGEIFGDTGWHVSLEQKTPGHVIGPVYQNIPLIVRGIVYMDYAEAYLLDSPVAKTRVPLWGTGFGGVLSVGPRWEARFLFSWPL